MRAVTYSAFGDPVALELVDVDEPEVGPDAVTVAVRAASVNPVDWKLAVHGVGDTLGVLFPVTPGWDVAGVVESVGSATTAFVPGDEVFGYLRTEVLHTGTYAERVAAPADLLARKPTSLTFEEAAAVPLAGLTAYQSLRLLDVGEGDTVVVHGAAGGVGLFAVQIALARGATVIGTASNANHGFLRDLGVTPVTHGDGLVERVRALAPDGVNAVADYHGGDLALSPQLLRDDSASRLVSVVDPAVERLGGTYAVGDPSADDLDALTGLIDRGELTVVIASTYPLTEVQRAWDKSRAGHTRGKIVITIRA